MVGLSKAPSSLEDHVLRGLKGLVQWVPALRQGSHCPSGGSALSSALQMSTLSPGHAQPQGQRGPGPSLQALDPSQEPRGSPTPTPRPTPTPGCPTAGPSSEACSGIQGRPLKGRVSAGLSSVLFSQGCGPASLLGRAACHSQQAYSGSPARLWLRPLFGQVFWV